MLLWLVYDFLIYLTRCDKILWKGKSKCPYLFFGVFREKNFAIFFIHFSNSILHQHHLHKSQISTYYSKSVMRLHKSQLFQQLLAVSNASSSTKRFPVSSSSCLSSLIVCLAQSVLRSNGRANADNVSMYRSRLSSTWSNRSFTLVRFRRQPCSSTWIYLFSSSYSDIDSV